MPAKKIVKKPAKKAVKKVVKKTVAKKVVVAKKKSWLDMLLGR